MPRGYYSGMLSSMVGMVYDAGILSLSAMIHQVYTIFRVEKCLPPQLKCSVWTSLSWTVFSFLSSSVHLPLLFLHGWCRPSFEGVWLFKLTSLCSIWLEWGPAKWRSNMLTPSGKFSLLYYPLNLQFGHQGKNLISLVPKFSHHVAFLESHRPHRSKIAYQRLSSTGYRHGEEHLGHAEVWPPASKQADTLTTDCYRKHTWKREGKFCFLSKQSRASTWGEVWATYWHLFGYIQLPYHRENFYQILAMGYLSNAGFSVVVSFKYGACL